MVAFITDSGPMRGQKDSARSRSNLTQLSRVPFAVWSRMYLSSTYLWNSSTS
jgi:hypothetical protein